MFVGPLTLTTINKDMPIVFILVLLATGSMGQGFQFPGTFMAILAVSEQAEQAVVTSTLMLWRSLGTVIGVASSSLVLQNALVKYLDAFVTGPDKEKVGLIAPPRPFINPKLTYLRRLLEKREGASRESWSWTRTTGIKS
jgi:hypothetical protein